MDIWSDIAKGRKYCLWCNGLKNIDGSKRHSSLSEFFDDEENGHRPKRKKATVSDDREERISGILQQLKEKHKGRFAVSHVDCW